MDRPKCWSCWKHFVVVEDGRGECHADLPTIGLLVRSILVRKGDGPEEEVEAQRKVAWGQWPSLRPSTPCCPLHPDFRAWVEHVEANPPASGGVSGDDDNPF
jgi:hypothetical protein